MKTSLSPASIYVPLLEKVGGVLALAAAIAFGTARLLEAASKDDEAEDDMDTTDYLLRTEAKRRRLLAAVERDKNRQFIAREPRPAA